MKKLLLAILISAAISVLIFLIITETGKVSEKSETQTNVTQPNPD